MNQKYDPDSGLVFVEGQFSARRVGRSLASMSQDWHRRSIQSESCKKRKRRRSTPSPSHVPVRSLFAMCRSKLWDNIGMIEEDAFEHVPTRILWDIWFHGQATRKPVPFHAWKAFVKYLSHKDARPESSTVPVSFWRQVQHIKKPVAPLTAYLTPISSPKLEFITHLTLAEGVSCPASHLLSLATMQNLGVLEIIQPRDPQLATTFPRVSDSIVREWSSGGSSSQKTIPTVTIVAFPSLRVLRIWGEDFVTHKSLQYVTKFPALAIYDVAGHEHNWPRRGSLHPDWSRHAGLFHKIRDEKLPKSNFAPDTTRLPSDPGLDRIRGAPAYQKMIIERIKQLTMTASLSEHDKRHYRSDSLSQFADMYKTVAIYRGTMSDPDSDITFIPAQGVPKEFGLIVKETTKHDVNLASMTKYPREETAVLMGFALYSQLGKLWADRELRTRKSDRVRVEQLATLAGQLVLSSLPYAQVRLGRDSYIKGYDLDRRDR
ncbi:hypothetical protein G7054_g4392 [Neopestalotiopsis clavispora]|nr:hypothetical protein G7054_g4392 [Neopestalotiopsis clavispora]